MEGPGLWHVDGQAGGASSQGLSPPAARGLLCAGHSSHADLVPAAVIPLAVVDTALLGLHAVAPQVWARGLPLRQAAGGRRGALVSPKSTAHGGQWPGCLRPQLERVFLQGGGTLRWADLT